MYVVKLFHGTAVYTNILKYTLKRNYYCGTCGKVFQSARSLSQHLKIPTGDKPYEYGTCGKVILKYTLEINLMNVVLMNVVPMVNLLTILPYLNCISKYILE